MSPAPTLDPDRTDQMRTFLVVEAASSVATATPARRPAAAVRRTLVAGGVATALVAGGLVAISLTDDAPAPTDPSRAEGTTTVALPDLQTIAVARSDGWTTVRLTDVDADPDAVVVDLQAAGFATERRELAVEVGPDGSVTVDPAVGSGDEEGEEGFAMLSIGSAGDGGEWGAEGLAGISVSGDDLWLESPPPPESGATEPVVLGNDEHPNLVRLHHDGSLSIRDGAQVSIVVFSAAV